MANGYLSNAFADTVVAAVFAGDTVSLPSSFWVGLTLALPTDGEGTGLEAPTAAEYARVAIPCDGASWASMGVGSRSIESAVDVDFPIALTEWGLILGYTLYDAVTDGVYLGFGITNPYIVTIGSRLRLPIGTIVGALPTT